MYRQKQDNNHNGLEDNAEILQMQQLNAQNNISREQLSNLYGNETQTNDFLRWALDLDPLLEFLKRRFLCQDLSEEGEWFQAKGSQPMMNITGATCITAFISSYLSKPGTFTNLNTEEINHLMYDFTIEIIKLIGLNYDQYEIRKSDMTMIETMCTSMVRMVLKMSYQKGVQDWTKPGISRLEHYYSMDKPRQRNNFGWMG